MSDYNFLMESRLSPAQFQLVNNLSRAASAECVNLYLVGGAVRDMTVGQTLVRDLDFAVEGDLQKILRHLPLVGKGRKRPGKFAHGREQGSVDVLRARINKKYRAVELWFANGIRAEIAQCRQEYFSAPGRAPTITSAMIFEDLKRRDFAFDAMAISLHANSRGLLLDPANGVSDIERREIRVLHSQSFLEDPVRIYRLLRLCLRFGFKPEVKTQRWLDAALENRAWENLLPEKQAQELDAVLREQNPERILKLYAAHGILSGLDRNLARIPYERLRKLHDLLRKLPGADLFLLNLHCLASKLSASQKKRLAKKVLVDSQTVNSVLNLDREAKKVARLLASSKFSMPSQSYKLLAAQCEPLVLFLLAYYPQVKIQTRLKNYLFKAPQVRSRLPRQELQALGIKPSAKFETILTRIFFDQLDGKIRSQQQLFKEFRSLAGIKEPVPPPSERPKPKRRSGAVRRQTPRRLVQPSAKHKKKRG